MIWCLYAAFKYNINHFIPMVLSHTTNTHLISTIQDTEWDVSSLASLFAATPWYEHLSARKLSMSNYFHTLFSLFNTRLYFILHLTFILLCSLLIFMWMKWNKMKWKIILSPEWVALIFFRKMNKINMIRSSRMS